MKRLVLLLSICTLFGCDNSGETVKSRCAVVLSKVFQCLDPIPSAAEENALEDEKCKVPDLADIKCDIDGYYRCVLDVLERSKCNIAGARERCVSPCPSILMVDDKSLLLCPNEGLTFAELDSNPLTSPDDPEPTEDEGEGDEPADDGAPPPSDGGPVISPADGIFLSSIAFTHTIGESSCPQIIGTFEVVNSTSEIQDYTVTTSSAATAVSENDFTLNPGESRLITVFFTCSQQTDVSDTLTVTVLTSGDQVSASVEGEVVRPE